MPPQTNNGDETINTDGSTNQGGTVNADTTNNETGSTTNQTTTQGATTNPARNSNIVTPTATAGQAASVPVENVNMVSPSTPPVQTAPRSTPGSTGSSSFHTGLSQNQAVLNYMEEMMHAIMEDVRQGPPLTMTDSFKTILLNVVRATDQHIQIFESLGIVSLEVFIARFAHQDAKKVVSFIGYNHANQQFMLHWKMGSRPFVNIRREIHHLRNQIIRP